MYAVLLLSKHCFTLSALKDLFEHVGNRHVIDFIGETLFL